MSVQTKRFAKHISNSSLSFALNVVTLAGVSLSSCDKHEIDQAELNYKIHVSCVSECSMDLNETT